MRKVTSEVITTSKEITIEELLEDFFRNYANLSSLENTIDSIDWYIKGESVILSNEERNYFEDSIRKLFKEKVIEYKQRESSQLQDRKSIIEFLEDVIDSSSLDEGDVGFLLSAEEIIDLIIKNGNK